MAISLNFRICQRGPLVLWYHPDFIVIFTKMAINVDIPAGNRSIISGWIVTQSAIPP